MKPSRIMIKKFCWKRTPNLGFKSGNGARIRGKWFTRKEIHFIIGIEGNLEVDLNEIGG